VVLDALLLALIQFAFIIGLHFLFPAVTLSASVAAPISAALPVVKK